MDHIKEAGHIHDRFLLLVSILVALHSDVRSKATLSVNFPTQTVVICMIPFCFLHLIHCQVSRSLQNNSHK